MISHLVTLGRRSFGIVEMGAGFESTIDIYLRVRPIVSGATALYEVDAEEGNVKWTIPRHGQLGMPNHQREHYSFKFTGIFDTESKQDEVFQKVAHKVQDPDPLAPLFMIFVFLARHDGRGFPLFPAMFANLCVQIFQ